MNDLAVKEKTSFKKEIWQTLSSIDVNQRTKQKNGLTYLSWAWAWGTLMEHYPDSEWEYMPEIFFPDGTCQVQIKVTVRDKDRHASRSIRLAVLNYSNKAIENPSASDISNASMRCLTKCISLFGLGHYIYADEDMPEAKKEQNVFKMELYKKFLQAVEANDHWGVAEFADHLNKKQWSDVIAKYDKTSDKAKVNSLKSKAYKIWFKVEEAYKEHKANNDELGMKELIEDLPEYWQNRLLEVAG